jgi:hypothetical protein
LLAVLGVISLVGFFLHHHHPRHGVFHPPPPQTSALFRFCLISLGQPLGQNTQGKREAQNERATKDHPLFFLFLEI